RATFTTTISVSSHERSTKWASTPERGPRRMDRLDVMQKLLDAAAAAAAVVMRVYAEADVAVELKGPNDPVTRADKEANALLLERLRRDFPGVPIVAEES